MYNARKRSGESDDARSTCVFRTRPGANWEFLIPHHFPLLAPDLRVSRHIAAGYHVVSRSAILYAHFIMELIGVSLKNSERLGQFSGHCLPET